MTPELVTPSSFLGSKQRGRATRETFALFAQKEKKKHLSLAYSQESRSQRDNHEITRKDGYFIFVTKLYPNDFE